MNEVRVAGVRLSHADKVLFPSQGITKRRLAEYWVAVADAVLPHLRRRPVSLLRCPEGEEGSCFFQRHPGAGLPEAIRSLDIEEKSGKAGRYLLLDGLKGVDVKIVGTDLETFIRRADLARDRGDQRSERFQVGQKVDARVTQFDRKARKVQVSIKALEVAEEKEAIAQYGSSDSGARLGDILGTALKQRGDKEKAE